MKKIIVTICTIAFTNVFADNHNTFNMAYVEVNDHSLANTGCYIRSDNNKPFFDMVSIFAANINGNNPNAPVIYFNPQVDTILNHSNQVANLQSKGIKVLLTLLGNHEKAGWACMTDEAAIKNFADQIVKTVNQYHLDGVDIDDEYSACAGNSTSLIRISQAVKNHPDFKGKILSKALFADHSYFTATYEGHKLADFLDYGWEMSYFSSNYASRLSPYVQSGMLKPNLALGISTNSPYSTVAAATTFVEQNGYGGVMVYNLTKDSHSLLAQIAKIQNGIEINVEPHCLS